ncbi:MAG: hypothetical protein ABL927_08660 [Bdellovibrionales bacterium]
MRLEIKKYFSFFNSSFFVGVVSLLIAMFYILRSHGSYLNTKISRDLASQSTATLALSFVMPAVGKINSNSLKIAPTAVAVSASDIEQGYVTVDQDFNFSVDANARAVFQVQFELSSKIFTGISLVTQSKGPTSEITELVCLADAKCSGAFLGVAQLGFKFNLSRGAVPGIYPWPLSRGVATVAIN